MHFPTPFCPLILMGGGPGSGLWGSPQPQRPIGAPPGSLQPAMESHRPTEDALYEDKPCPMALCIPVGTQLCTRRGASSRLGCEPLHAALLWGRGGQCLSLGPVQRTRHAQACSRGCGKALLFMIRFATTLWLQLLSVFCRGKMLSNEILKEAAARGNYYMSGI